MVLASVLLNYTINALCTLLFQTAHPYSSASTASANLYRCSPLVHHTAASEVSSILEGRIAGASTGGDVQETGRVLSECLTLARVSGRGESSWTSSYTRHINRNAEANLP